ncbi:hypothetical protein IP92_00610 [Pseudoduganella flava]|uniref:Tetratricopeptide repeat protein n=1 Tax=Pseudoduganella flava TaxID=871742 RepID=A0A562Q4F8_9BURK|nr:hypothetical protein [Pseudoduganella flava]QGZ41633.1 hypothetical protein GO485_22975 [Pseudoduganella flava]TWI51623.1 hypothetical protein IP92_00610 [Pseudoduganella flava]
MSQFRLARISLLLAAIGLNAATALTGAAYAQDKPAAQAEAPKDVVRPEIFKLVDPAQIKPLMDAKNYAEVKSRLAQADALPNKTPYEEFVLNRMRIAVASATNDNATMTTALEAVINSGKLQPNEQRDFIQALANQYYNNKDYAKAITWFNRYQTETGDTKVRQYIIRAYYFSNDFATAKTELLKDLEAAQKAGTTPKLEELQLLANTGAKTKDQATYLMALENLVRYYPNDDYWLDLLSRTQGKSTYSNRFALDVLRLEKVAVSKMSAEEYTALAELALLAGQPIEAKQALDAGFSNGVLGTGTKAGEHKKLRAQADKQAADDMKNIGSGEASARKSKNGTGLINLGYAYVTLGQYDKGITLIQEGISKGGLQNTEDAKLRLGYSLALAGRKDEAVKTLQTVTGSDGRGDLARYWIMWINRPAGGSAPAQAAQ